MHTLTESIELYQPLIRPGGGWELQRQNSQSHQVVSLEGTENTVDQKYLKGKGMRFYIVAGCMPSAELLSVCFINLGLQMSSQADDISARQISDKVVIASHSSK